MTALDIALALGPGRAPDANMTAALRSGIVVGLVFVIPLELAWRSTVSLRSAPETPSALLRSRTADLTNTVRIGSALDCENGWRR